MVSLKEFDEAIARAHVSGDKEAENKLMGARDLLLVALAQRPGPEGDEARIAEPGRGPWS